MIFCFYHPEDVSSKSYLFVTYNDIKGVYELSGEDPFGGNSMFNFQMLSIDDIKEFIERNFLFRGLILDSHSNPFHQSNKVKERV
jgi:hypothetical protein